MASIIFLLLVSVISSINTAHIGLFASTGCYSHDMLMRNLADRLNLQGGHKVTFIQIRVYEFNRTFPPKKGHWDYLSFNSTDPEAAKLQRRSQKLMWLMTLPFDGDRFDRESIGILAKIHRQHMRACFHALRNQDFINRLENLHLDLLVIDYLLNECAIGLAHAYTSRVKVVYLSNYPIVSSYVDKMGVSSNPAYVPVVMSPEKWPMTIWKRTSNAFFYLLLFGTRLQMWNAAKRTFRLASNIDLPSLSDTERKTLIFATPFEMLLDTPRPMMTGLRYFGCEHCSNIEDSKLVGPIRKLNLKLVSVSNSSSKSVGLVSKPAFSELVWKPVSKLVPKLVSVSMLKLALEPLLKLTSEPVSELVWEPFANLDSELAREPTWKPVSETKSNVTRLLALPEPNPGLILVSFGTVTRGDSIPLMQLKRLLITFAKFDQYDIIWQLDASEDYFETALIESLNTTRLPKHIRVLPWIPLRTLLNDPRVVLLVSHGGVTTCIEAVNSGVPVLGIAIQGDQSYNLRRFAEKGVGEFFKVSSLNVKNLEEKMTKMIRENEKYKKAASKLRKMLRDYKTLDQSPSVFWLGWAVRHFGGNETDQRRIWNENIFQSKHSSNWLVYYNVDVMLVAGSSVVLIYVLATTIIS